MRTDIKKNTLTGSCLPGVGDKLFLSLTDDQLEIPIYMTLSLRERFLSVSSPLWLVTSLKIHEPTHTHLSLPNCFYIRHSICKICMYVCMYVYM